MLVLSRKTEQEIQIGPNITIKILQVQGQTVRVGIVAPRDVSVMRTEVAQRIQNESRSQTMKRAVSKRPDPKPRTNKRAEPSKLEANSLKRILRCRASGAVSTPSSTHPERPGPASLLSCTAPAVMLAPVVVAHCS